MASFIKEITLWGFKSFAEKTTIQLKDGLNMIVGPNGCGKSNIVDAFSWAFGESQIKNLRSNVGTDIIFAGTQKRTGSFNAQVSFTVDNKQGLLNYDAPLITIKRQINKENESEFFINQVSCRLKDIQNLFLDTGLGKNTYSILQQGKIDQIVVGKPEDRRILIEEAAGIRHTKLLIKESQTKLNKTEDNLTRLEDILQEIQVQHSILKQQASKAMEYKELKEQIQVEEKQVFYLRLTWIKQREINHQQQLLELDGKIKLLEGELLELEDLEPTLQEDMLELQDKKERADQKKSELMVKEAQITQKIELWKKEYQNLQDRIDNLKQKQNIFTGIINEKQTLAQDLSSSSLLLDVPKNELEKTSQLLIQEQSTLKVLEIEYQNLVSNFLIKEQTIEKKALEKILAQNKEQKTLTPSLKAKQQELLDQENSILNKIEYLFTHQQFKTLEECQKLYKELEQQYFLLKVLQDQIKSYYIDQIIFLEQENHLFLQYFNNLDSHKQQAEFEVQRQQKEKILLEQREKIEYLQNYLGQLQKQFKSLEQEQIKKQMDQYKLEQEASFYQNSITELQSDLLDLTLKQEEYQDNMDEAFGEYELLLQDQTIYEQESTGYQEQYKKIIQKMDEYQQQKKEKNKQYQNYQEKIQSLSIQAKEVEIEQKLLLEEFESRYFKFHFAEWEAYQIKENLSVLSQEKLGKKLQLLHQNIQHNKDRLSSLGMVNFLAIEEYEKVNTRYEFLLQNKQDIQKSKSDLLILIEDLQKESNTNFLAVFEKVNQHLQEVFQIAFNGGSCEMVLTDKQNPLQGGVDIIAQPPGKKLQNLNLLSGGEKTMVALSILFSLFMVKPSPFCLMDEVDAALDEMNIDRFLRILNRFKDKVQFMIITHNRTTAQKGDIFYGVTMQETGISKVFSFLPDNKLS